MRTYSRKRPEYKEIENVQSLCRLCLGNADDGTPIFKDNESDDVCSTVALRITMCVGLEMANEESLPRLICKKCHTELERYYTFRKKCEASYQKLKCHLVAIKEKEYNLKMVQEKEQSELTQSENEVDGSKAKGSNLVFTINMDGTISVSENNIPSDGPIVTLKRLEDNSSVFLNRETEQNQLKQSEASILKSNITNSNKESLVQMNDLQNNPISNQQSTVVNILEPDQPGSLQINIDSQNTKEITDIETEQVDFSMFLSNMLVELGILKQQNNTVEFVNTDLKVMEIDTDDGNQLTVEFTEEDSDVEQQEEVEKVDSEEGKQPIIIQYLTSNTKEKHYSEERQYKTSVPPAWCPTCDKKFASSSVLSRHIRAVHERERPFGCRVCGRTFAQKEVMLRHEHLHEAERPFKCEQCPKSYAQRGSLLAHVRTHLPIHAKPLSLHQCPICPKVFLYDSGLSRHVLSSHRGRTYVCNECNKQYTDKSALRRHLQSITHNTKLELPPSPPALTPAPQNMDIDNAG